MNYLKMLMKLLTLLALLICSGSFAQTKSYQNLLDSALKGYGSIFAFSKPLKVTRLDRSEMEYCFENIIDFSNQKLDTVMFSQIIENSKTADTTLWTDNELPNFLLVNDRGKTVSKQYAIQKFQLTDKKQMKSFKKHITRFNSTEISDRIICYYSRPIFDNSKTFAVVQWENGHSFLGGRGGITLFQLQSDKTWKEYGVILNWRY